MIFAFQVLPIVIFIASFFAILYYLGVMQWVVKGMAIGMQKVMGVSGAESLNVAASIFMGQTEAPLTIRPFIAGMTRIRAVHDHDERHGARFGRGDGGVREDRGRVEIEHLLTAVIMTAPATIMLAKIFIPETDKPATAGKVEVKIEKTAVNVIDAAAQGAGDGLHLALNIARHADRVPGADRDGATAFSAGCTACRAWAGCRSRCEKIFGVVFAPVAWLMGVPWKDASAIGDLLGTRLVLNEFVAFLEARARCKAHARSAVVHDRHLRAVRVREFQLDRDSDRRHRRAGAQPQVGPGAARAARRGGGIDGEFHVGLHRGNAAVIEEAQAVHRRAAQRCARRSAWCWAADWARSPTS